MHRGSYKTNYPLQVLCVLVVWQLVNDVFERPTSLMLVGFVWLYFFSNSLAHDICLGRATRLDGNYYAHYISFREKDTVLALMK